jgi:hypothetical protein
VSWRTVGYEDPKEDLLHSDLDRIDMKDKGIEEHNLGILDCSLYFFRDKITIKVRQICGFAPVIRPDTEFDLPAGYKILKIAGYPATWKKYCNYNNKISPKKLFLKC